MPPFVVHTSTATAPTGFRFLEGFFGSKNSLLGILRGAQGPLYSGLSIWGGYHLPLYSGLSIFGGDQGPQPGALSHLGLAISCGGCYVWDAATAWRSVGVCSSSCAIDATRRSRDGVECGQSQ